MKNIILLFLITLSLYASSERKIIIGSYQTERETLKAFETFQSQLDANLLALQQKYQFNFVARTSGSAYLIAIEPFNNYQDAKNVKAALNNAYADAFINKYTPPENERLLATQQPVTEQVIQEAIITPDETNNTNEIDILTVEQEEELPETITKIEANTSKNLPVPIAPIEENTTLTAPKTIPVEATLPQPFEKKETTVVEPVKPPHQAIDVVHVNHFDLYHFSLVVLLAILLVLLILLYRKNRLLQQVLKRSKLSYHNCFTTKNALEETLASKNMFLENLTNSLKEPVDSILNASHALRNLSLERKDHDMLDAIILSSSKLDGVISNIIDITKLRSNHLELEHIEFNLNQVLETVASSVHKKALEHNTELTFDMDTQLPVKFMGDPLRINQIMTNILNRSITNAERGEVIISVKELKRSERTMTLEFVFRDTGIGYKQEEIDTFFNDFADANVYDLDSNAKIGLVMSKQLIHKMKGNIVLKSSYGHGSSFIFDITLELPEKVEQRKYRLPYKKIMDYSVLILDNNVLAARVLRQQLEYFHLKVKPSFSWEHAVKMLNDEFQHIDLLILNTTILAETSLEELAKVVDKKAFQIAFIVHDMRDINYQIIERFKHAHYLHKPYTQKKLLDLLVKIHEINLENNS